MNHGQVRFSTKVICTVATWALLIAGMGSLPAVAQTPTENQKVDSGPSADSRGEFSSQRHCPEHANAEVLKELQQMRARITELEAQLKAQQGHSQTAADSRNQVPDSLRLI